MKLQKNNSGKIFRKIIKVISIGIMFSAMLTLFGAVIIITYSFPLFSKVSFSFKLLTVAGWIIVIIIGPYASIQLWRLKKGGRNASFIILIYSIIYYILTLYYYPPPELQVIVIKLIIAVNFFSLLIILSPQTQRLINRDDYSWFSRFPKVIKNLTSAEKITLITSVTALVLSLIGIYYGNFYKHNSLKCSVTDAVFNEDKIILTTAFINDGNLSSLVNRIGIAFARKEEVYKTFFADVESWTWAKDVKVHPQDPLILKPGDVKLVKVDATNMIPNEIENSEDSEYLIGLAINSTDFKGESYWKYSRIGTAQTEAGKIISLRMADIQFIRTELDGTSIKWTNRSHSFVIEIY